jgi:hypothetical protein
LRHGRIPISLPAAKNKRQPKAKPRRQTSKETAMSNDDDYAPDEEAGRALVEEFQNNARLSAERVKYDPWQHEYRRVAAEVERTGNQSLFADLSGGSSWL